MKRKLEVHTQSESGVFRIECDGTPHATIHLDANYLFCTPAELERIEQAIRRARAFMLEGK